MFQLKTSCKNIIRNQKIGQNYDLHGNDDATSFKGTNTATGI